MSWPLAIDTPLGPLEVALTCGIVPACAPDNKVTLPSGAVVAVWRDVAGVVVDLLLTRYDGASVVPDGYVAPECWGWSGGSTPATPGLRRWSCPPCCRRAPRRRATPTRTSRWRSSGRTTGAALHVEALPDLYAEAVDDCESEIRGLVP